MQQSILVLYVKLQSKHFVSEIKLDNQVLTLIYECEPLHPLTRTRFTQTKLTQVLGKMHMADH